MIITDKFIVLNFPKTGSTFVRTVLERIHRTRTAPLWKQAAYKVGLARKPLFKTLMLPNLMISGLRANIPNQHGKWSQIPDEYKHLPVVSVARNPFDRLVSQYEFRWWATHPVEPPEVLRLRFPRFPDLSFREFLELEYSSIRLRIAKNPRTVMGPMAAQMVTMYAKDRDAMLDVLDDEYIESGQYLIHFPELHFLRTERLNEDLKEFLLGRGYLSEEVDFISTMGKIQPKEGTNRKPGRSWIDYYDDETLNLVWHREQLAFKIYADHGVDYTSEFHQNRAGLPFRGEAVS
jgi:hypothetical protein